jgi:hypothetical protein
MLVSGSRFGYYTVMGEGAAATVAVEGYGGVGGAQWWASYF